MILLTLRHVELGALVMETREREARIFSSKDKAEQWLRDNGFLFRPRQFLKGEPFDWCREDEKPWDHVEVDFEELDLDDVSPCSPEFTNTPQIW